MKSIKYLSFFLILLGLASCQGTPSDEESGIPKNAMLFYGASANNLQSEIWQNIQTMTRNYVPTDDKNIYVYFKKVNGKSSLYQVKKSELAEIKQYDESINCATAETLDLVMGDVEKLGNVIKITDIALSSHGSSWIPTIIISPLSKDGTSPALQNKEREGITAYSFGQDYLDRLGTTINIDEMAKVFEKYDLNSILFDACYMCSIEVLYQLRNSANYILASPAEIIAEGICYEKITPYLTQPITLQSLSMIANETYQFYNKKNDPFDRSLTLTVTDCAKLKELAPLIKEITTAYGDLNDSAAPSTILRYDGYTNSVAKDYYTYLTNLLTIAGDQHYQEPLKTAWDKAFPHFYHTDYLFGVWPMKDAHGVAGYVYRETNIDPKFNLYYKTLDWGKLISRP